MTTKLLLVSLLSIVPACAGDDTVHHLADAPPDAAAPAAPDAAAVDAPAPPPPPTGHAIAIRTFANRALTHPESAAFVAIEDGDGPWQVIAPTAVAGTYAATVAGDRFGVAVGCITPTGRTVAIDLRTVADGTTIARSCDTAAAHEVTSRIAAPAGITRVALAYPFVSHVASSDNWAPAFAVGAGPTELVATVVEPDGQPARVYRSPEPLAIADDTGTFDVAFGDALRMSAAAVAITGPAPTAFATSLVTPTGEYLLDAADAAARPAPTYARLPDALAHGGDLYAFDVTGTAASARVYAGAGPIAIALPAPYTASFTATTDANPRVVAELPVAAADLPRTRYLVTAQTTQPGDDTDLTTAWSAELTTAWRAPDAATFTLGDLAGAAIDPAFLLAHHQQIRVSAAFVQASDATPVPGARVLTARTDSAIGSYCGDGIVDYDAGESCDSDSPTCTACQVRVLSGGGGPH